MAITGGDDGDEGGDGRTDWVFGVSVGGCRSGFLEAVVGLAGDEGAGLKPGGGRLGWGRGRRSETRRNIHCLYR